MRISLRRAAHHKQRGFTLIEIMISILILALGMLGIASMQATALRNSQSAYERSQGVVQTYSIIDSMRANKAAAIVNRYDLLVMTCNELGAGTTLAAEDLRRWIRSLKDNLGPNACGQIDCDQAECFVKVRWDDSRGTEGGTFEVTTRTRL